MKQHLRNALILAIPFFIYWLFLAGAVYWAWGILGQRITFSLVFGVLSTGDLFWQIPHCALYFAFGMIASRHIRSSNTGLWILLLCLIGCAMQTMLSRHHFVEGVPLARKIMAEVPKFITPWFAWIGHVVRLKQTGRGEQIAAPLPSEGAPSEGR